MHLDRRTNSNHNASHDQYVHSTFTRWKTNFLVRCALDLSCEVLFGRRPCIRQVGVGHSLYCLQHTTTLPFSFVDGCPHATKTTQRRRATLQRLLFSYFLPVALHLHRTTIPPTYGTILAHPGSITDPGVVSTPPSPSSNAPVVATTQHGRLNPTQRRSANRNTFASPL